jgi:hypothetical protein
MGDWNAFTRPQKIQIASDAIRVLREVRKTSKYEDIYIPERDGHYPILGLITRWMEVLDELDREA